MPTPDRTSLAAIIETGRALLEHGGPPNVTMQAIADRVGVRAPSLYKRVRDRDALLTLIATATVEDLSARLDTSDGTLAQLIREYRSFALEHPEGFRLMFAATGAADVVDRASAPVLRAVRAAVGPERALDEARLLTAWATGFVSMELSGAFRLGGDIDEAFEYGLNRLISE